VLGLREISFHHSGIIKDNNGATPTLNNLETPLDYYNKNKERLSKFKSLIANIILV